MILGHGLVFCLATVSLISAVLMMLIQGPSSHHFSWRPGVLTVLSSYSTYLIQRGVSPESVQTMSLTRLLYLIIPIIVLPIDISVLARILIASFYATYQA